MACDVDWSALADMIAASAGALAALATAWMALSAHRALAAWRSELAGGTDHEVARRALLGLARARFAYLASWEEPVTPAFVTPQAFQLSNEFLSGIAAKQQAVEVEVSHLEGIRLEAESLWGKSDSLSRLVEIMRERAATFSALDSEYEELGEANPLAVFYKPATVLERFETAYTSAGIELTRRLAHRRGDGHHDAKRPSQ